MDGEVSRLFDEIAERYPELRQKFCVIAIGGYGRMELCPESDLDLLYLFEDLPESLLTESISYINNFLYDSKKQIGHSCRTIEETKQYLDNPESFYALLDARLIAGSETVYEKFLVNVLYDLPTELCMKYGAWKKNHLRDKIHSERPFLVAEPNLKNDPFCLRDMQTIYWLEKLNSNYTSLPIIHSNFNLMRGEFQSFENAYDFFLKTRTAIHTLEKYKNDRLDLTIQSSVAEYLNLGPKDELNSVDRLMHLFYEHQHQAYFFISIYLDHKRIQKKRKLEDFEFKQITLQKKKNYLYPPRMGSFFSHPDTVTRDIMQIFQLCQEQNLILSATLMNEIRFAAEFLQDNFQNSKIAIDIFWQILRKQTKAGRILTEMHHCNILEKLIPEFGACKYFPLFSYHHEYPVDEHTLYILRELDTLVDGTFDDEQVQAEFVKCEQVEILYIAILIHDAGKVREGDHCQYGAEMANSIGERMGLTEDEIDLFRFLVEKHIDMSEVSSKRDISDPLLISNFANSIGSEERLRLLYVLTIIDTKSVGPGVLTNWKKDILYRLFKLTLAHFQKEIPIPKKDSQKEKLRNYLQEKEKVPEQYLQEILDFAGAMQPESYLHFYSPRKILQHYVNYNRAMHEPNFFPEIECAKEPAMVLVTVYSKNYKFLMSDISGTVSSLGLNVVGLRSFSVHDTAITQVQITQQDGSGNILQERMQRLQDTLVSVILGKTAVADLLDSPVSMYMQNEIPQGMVEEMVTFQNELHKDYTILEVRLPDSIGLLYRILKILLSFGLELDFIRASTSADYIYDSFYLKNAQGEKVTDPQVLQEIQQQIQLQIQAKPEIMSLEI